ncbi:uncharacterized protein LOC132203229 [Neocloeon triangulifer]|uniref:uncharacterized protein LOC132203229 n=1 Tax=Neocloeon triangulifer TaxID=2078957 RepID=UPI00286F762B|nr:uncharacterized protein LOC132203229 [Neocloeon triangulifer]
MRNFVFLTLLALVGCATTFPQSTLPQNFNDLTSEQLIAELESFLVKIDAEPRGIDESLVAILESFRATLQQGFPTLGIPPLDPLLVPHGQFDIETATADVKGSFDNVTVNGISAYTINKVHMDMLRMKINFDLLFNVIDTLGDRYDVDGVLAVLPIYGTGPFEFTILNMSMIGEVKMGLVNGSVQVLSMPIDINIAAVSSNMMGIMGGGAMGTIVNDMIDDFAPIIFNEIKAPIIDAAVQRIVAFVNARLQGLTFQDLIDIILGIGGGKFLEMYN